MTQKDVGDGAQTVTHRDQNHHGPVGTQSTTQPGGTRGGS